MAKAVRRGEKKTRRVKGPKFGADPPKLTEKVSTDLAEFPSAPLPAPRAAMANKKASSASKDSLDAKAEVRAGMSLAVD